MKRVQDSLRKKQALALSAAMTSVLIVLYLFFMYQRALTQVNDGIRAMESNMLAIFNENELIADAAGVRFQQLKHNRLCGNINDIRPRNRDEWGINADRSALSPGYGTLVTRTQSEAARCMFAAGEFVRLKMNELNPGQNDTHRYIVSRDAEWFYWFNSKDSVRFSFATSQMARHPNAFFQTPETFYDRLLLKDSRVKALSATSFYTDKITGEKSYSLVSYIYDLSAAQVSNNIIGYLLYDFSKAELRRVARESFNKKVPSELVLKFVNRQDGSHICLTDNCAWPTVFHVHHLSDRYEFRYALPLYLYILHDPMASPAVLLAPLIFLLFFFLIRRRLDSVDHRFYSDALTGCYTRNIMALIQKHALRYRAVLLFDCNKFKAINDAWGHNAGDSALKIIAQCMLDNVRGERDLVIRTGGDEFVILLTDASKEEARYIAERITLQIVQYDFTVEDEQIPLSVSWGMAAEVDDLDSAIQQADDDMYRMKKSEQ